MLDSARRHGLKVMHGVWVSSDPEKTTRQVETSIALAKAYPDVIIAIVVGNEVLLRGEMTANDLASIIRHVKAQVAVPVTYADVWEFWLRYPDVQNAVDFVTIHILPYWEDFPIPAAQAAAHVAAIRAKVAAAIPGKDIVIGEFGWPSAGRMREGARPSPSNQARAVIETLALAQHDKFRLNVIEAFDQPWKRALEGAVGGYWGIFDRAAGGPKFRWPADRSPIIRIGPLQALAGVIVAALAFAGAFLAGRRKQAFADAVAAHRRAHVAAGDSVRLDARNGCHRKLQRRQLAAFDRLRGRGRGGADRLRGGMRRRAAAAGLCRALASRRRAPRCARLAAWRNADRVDAVCASKRRSGSSSIRATATYRLRR